MLPTLHAFDNYSSASGLEICLPSAWWIPNLILLLSLRTSFSANPQNYQKRLFVCSVVRCWRPDIPAVVGARKPLTKGPRHVCIKWLSPVHIRSRSLSTAHDSLFTIDGTSQICQVRRKVQVPEFWYTHYTTDYTTPNMISRTFNCRQLLVTLDPQSSVTAAQPHTHAT